MKKKMSLVVISCFIGLFALNAQTFNKGNGVLNLEIGFGNSYYTFTGLSTTIPPLSASYEVGIVDNVIDKGVIGIGGFIGLSEYSESYFDGSWKSTHFVIGPRGVFHYPLVDKLDTYVGLMLVYDNESVSASGTGGLGFGASASTVRLPGFVGARYYFTDKIAIVGELNWSIAYFNIGVAFKLK
jgi:hypothetical protein